jgi:hypothetical protein
MIYFAIWIAWFGTTGAMIVAATCMWEKCDCGALRCPLWKRMIFWWSIVGVVVLLLGLAIYGTVMEAAARHVVEAVR